MEACIYLISFSLNESTYKTRRGKKSKNNKNRIFQQLASINEERVLVYICHLLKGKFRFQVQYADIYICTCIDLTEKEISEHEKEQNQFESDSILDNISPKCLSLAICLNILENHFKTSCSSTSMARSRQYQLLEII